MKKRLNKEMLQVEKLVEELADKMKWNWTEVSNHRDAANAVLETMAELGLIRQEEHPLGGCVWIVNGRLYGRTDDVVYYPRGRKSKIKYVTKPDSEFVHRRGKFVRRRKLRAAS